MSFQMSSNVSSERGKEASSLGVISPKRVSIGGGCSSSFGRLVVVRLAMSVCSGEENATPFGDEAMGALFGGEGGGESGLTDACALRLSAEFCVTAVAAGLIFSAPGTAVACGCKSIEESSTPRPPSSRKYEMYSPVS